MTAETKAPLRIGALVADPLRIEGLRAILAEVAELVPMSAAETVHDDALAMLLIDGRSDDLLLRMAAFRRARPSLRILVLGDDNDPGHIGRVIGSGARGYLLFTAQAREIRMAVEVVADGSIWAPRKVLASLIDTLAMEIRRPQEIHLTERERDVLRLLIKGQGNREIGEELGIETKTVKTNMSRLLQKFGVPNRAALTVRALEMNVSLGLGTTEPKR